MTPTWSTACPDWRERIRAGKSLIPFDPLFPDQASAALDVFRELKIVDAIGSPRIGDSCRPWITDFAGAIFGSYDPESGRRLIREFFLLISKKNSKSTTAAAVMGTALLRNWRQSGEFLILAPTVEVANNSFFPIRDMVKADEELTDLLHVQDHLKLITHRTTGATLKVVAADSETVSGKKATGVLIDELWLFGKRANAENMLREATGGLVSRPEGFVVYLSTQSDEPPAGVFRQKLNYFRDVRDGKIVDPRSLPVIYEFPEEMVADQAYLNPANFGITNPNLGLSVDREWLEDELAKAQNAGPESLRGFLAKHLNVEIGLALRSDRWAGADFWEGQGDPSLTLDQIIARAEVITVGIDGGGLDDLLGLGVIGRDKQTREWLHWGHAWAHELALERRKNEAARLRDFEAAGDLTIVKDMREAFAQLAAQVALIERSSKLATVGLDPVGVGLIIDALAAEGIAGDDRVVGVSQGYKLQGAIKTAEVKLASGELNHCAQPLMAWSVGNAKVELKGNAITITKQQSGSGKIDPLMAAFDAVALMAMNPEPKGGRSFWDSAA